MSRRSWQAAMASVGAVIGAGFASGQEIVGFFARYGVWSWLGIGAAVSVIWMIARGCMEHHGPGGMPRRWQGSTPGLIWQGMFALLMLTTGSAMLAGGGEIFALTLPVRGAWLLGIAATGYLAWRMMHKGGVWQSGVSSVLAVMLVMIAAGGMMLPRRPGALLVCGGPWSSMASGGCYAGFNMALAAPVLAQTAESMTQKERSACAVLTALVLGVLLSLGNGLMLHHQALTAETLPMVHLALILGKAGYYLACACMYLAIVTTACAAAEGLQVLLPEGRGWRFAAMSSMFAGVAMGFAGLVERVYPLLGAGCLALMAWAYIGKNEKNA